jgi:hypothetical protein
MNLEVAVVAVGLPGQQAFELALGDLPAQDLELRLGLRDDACIAFGFAELDETELVFEIARDRQIAVDRAIQPVALAQDRLRRLRLVPEVGVLRLGVQLGETPIGLIPVKDASSAGPERHAPHPPPLEFPLACYAFPISSPAPGGG